MAKLSFSSDSMAISRRMLLTGAVGSASALVLAACGGTEAGPVPTVTRVPAEGAPPTQTPAPPATPGASPVASPVGGEATPAASAEAATPEGDGGGAATVGPLVAIDIGWKLGDLSTLAGDAITLTVAPGTTFEMISEAAAEHDFTVDALGVHVPVAPGETVEVTIPADAAPGEYEFYCSVVGHKAAGMVGTLVVEEGGAAVDTDAAETAEPDAAQAPAPAEPVGPLIAIDIGWKLGELSTLAGDAITLTVVPGTTFEMISEGAAEHNFVVDALALEVPVAPGETTTVTIPAEAAPGEYEFYCSIVGHKAAGMVGTLVVQEGGAAEAAPAAEEAAGPASPPAEAAGGGDAVGPLVAIDIGWKLGDLSTLAGDAITLTVAPGTTFEMISEGAAEHDFTVDALAVYVLVAPGETVEVTIPADAAPGEYEFYCSVPGHKQAGMVGTLVVR